MKISITRLIIGIWVIVLGVVLLLNNLGITEFDASYIAKILISAVLIGIGIDLVLKRFGWLVSSFGIIIAFIGVNILLKNLGLYYIEMTFLWGIIWPLILILIGIKFITTFKKSEENRIAFMGSIEDQSDGWNLKNSTYTAFMAGIELDLTKATIKEGKTELDLTAIMGGIDIYVPRDVNVICSGSLLFGGLEFFNKSTGGIISVLKGEQKADSNKIIKINCDVMFGGIEVKTKITE